ncbi:MAG: response regulator [Candidatus Peribacteraceae bacterium]|nr:response regulator [Candidatus Peribacteraceae bacterium]MDD5074538.1 response regulator [Candidatus Peribacteraceae bacterium]
MSKRILIAEDDVFLCKMYKLGLEGLGYEIEMVPNGKDAIAAVAKNPPDLLLLDLLMPDVDGFEVLREIREKGQKFPVIILSNLSQEIDKEKCRTLGASDYFTKSDMELDQLAAIIKKYV